MQTLLAGQTAPDFTLLNQHQQSVTLSTLLKKQRVLVYFYPKAMTPGCTVQACALRDSQAEIQAHNVVVLGISTAGSLLFCYRERHAGSQLRGQ